ncbi:hypothetical protein A9264_12820 [Vibrio sp. UCD-FRSSP16_10]|uniref:hypothetical protein n=1 Tax=unclassified Vibrio TaxID=2614977 RepID=UPI0007FD1CE3|nr:MULTISPECIES: hypothetical protein [unclassified Vibrio]OBT15544.1 hypothetical protein A9260_13035 [Vibrio sp. UCD-FRSSP16_30]OBT20617.1 hypothetical protein A9264_12820 [Vibrio sp. UCD-FRSSP16_10]
MDASKALKKLKKKSVKKIKNKKVDKLKNLRLETGNADKTNHHSNDKLKGEIQSVVNQVMIDAAVELATPLKPILSWFNDHQGYQSDFVEILGSDESISQKVKEAPVTPVAKKRVEKPVVQPQKISIQPANANLYVAFKSPACKRCPALKNGICKCAAKRYQLSA